MWGGMDADNMGTEAAATPPAAEEEAAPAPPAAEEEEEAPAAPPEAEQSPAAAEEGDAEYTRHIDDRTGAYFYVSKVTGQATWVEPRGFEPPPEDKRRALMRAANEILYARRAPLLTKAEEERREVEAVKYAKYLKAFWQTEEDWRVWGEPFWRRVKGKGWKGVGDMAARNGGWVERTQKAHFDAFENMFQKLENLERTLVNTECCKHFVPEEVRLNHFRPQEPANRGGYMYWRPERGYSDEVHAAYKALAGWNVDQWLQKKIPGAYNRRWATNQAAQGRGIRYLPDHRAP